MLMDFMGSNEMELSAIFVCVCVCDLFLSRTKGFLDGFFFSFVHFFQPQFFGQIG